MGRAKKHPTTQVAPEPAALTALRREASQIGWPIHFATDIEHDARAIGAMLPHEPFTWCLRADGTHIGRVVDAADHRAVQSRLTMRAVAEAFTAAACRFYVWDGHALHPEHSAAAADLRLAELATQRYEVRARRACSLVPHRVASRVEADRLAIDWERKYGEDFITVDTWGTR